MMSPQIGGHRTGECSIDIIPYQEESFSKSHRTFSDDSRCPSHSSSLNSNSGDICRICHCEGAADQPLITPCYCAGSLKYVHQNCLQQWIKSSNIRSCELCKFQFIMQTKVKPFNEWEYLEMSGLERKKLLCAMLFHIIAMTCVCWSLYVLIDRTLDEVRKGHLEWPFWTKLIVVGIGFMGGIVFMYIQCRAYFVLCKRWKAYNRVIYVQNAPEKVVSQASKLLPSSAIRDNGPSCSLRNYSDSCRRDSLPETSCIDIKGVRNLHIIFGEENQIRFHHEKSEKRPLTEDDHYEDKKDDSSHSLHIQINGNSNRGRNINSGKNSNDVNTFGGTMPPAGCKPELESKMDMFSNQKRDQSVVKLQFKKAEIVIEFEKNNGAKSMKFSNRNVDEADGLMPSRTIVWDGIELDRSPKRRFSSEEYLDLETKYKVANEATELPTSKLLINERSIKIPACGRDKPLIKDWKSSEDLVAVKNSSTKF